MFSLIHFLERHSRDPGYDQGQQAVVCVGVAEPGSGDELQLSWIFRGSVVSTKAVRTRQKPGIAFGEFARPDYGWPKGFHAVRIEGKGQYAQINFEIADSRTPAEVASRLETMGYEPVWKDWEATLNEA
jgi:hypothetical protein